MHDSATTIDAESSDIQLSIIIPVYNAAAYLTACLDSISRQANVNLEIICVDDASKDESCGIIQNLADADSRISLYHQTTNAGAPTARNVGIGHARGKYLMFMDADDYLLDDSLPKLLEKAEQLNCDAIKGCMYNDKGKGRLEPHRLNQSNFPENTNLSACRDIQHLYQYQSYLFLSSTIRDNEVTFDVSLKNFQDPVFLSHLLPLCRSICVTSIPFYARRIRDNSIITSNWNRDNYSSLIRGATIAYQNLMNQQQWGAAAAMALTFSRWWYKFELMPELLDPSESQEILEGIAQFSKQSNHPVCRFSLGRIHVFNAIRQILRGRYDKCYHGIVKRNRLKKALPGHTIKLYDLVQWAVGGS